jgi:hypothetical protein
MLSSKQTYFGRTPNEFLMGVFEGLQICDNEREQKN